MGPYYATPLRRRRPQPGDTWHWDAVLLTSTGQRDDRWRAVDQGGTVLAILGQRRRAKQAATPCVRTLLQGGQYVPRGIVTDQLGRDSAAPREMLPGTAHRQRR
ncbi:MAG: DDE-type integrase/transposase/recombinase [Candidatus Entotheonellia bacterium]